MPSPSQSAESLEDVQQFRLAVAAAELGTFIWYPQSGELDCDERIAEMIQLPDGLAPTLDWLLEERVHPEDTMQVRSAIQEAANPAGDGRYCLEHRVKLADGSSLWLLGQGQMYFRDVDGARQASRMIFTATDVTARRQSEEALRGQARALQLAVHGTNLSKVLEILVHTAESVSGGGILCSILLLNSDGAFFRECVAPSLPDAFNDAFAGLEIGPDSASCGTAAWSGRDVVTTDIATDPRWERYREVALAIGLSACWSMPIFSSQGKLLGTFAVYDTLPREPSSQTRKLVDLLAHTAAVVIERDLEIRDRQSAEQQVRSREGRLRFLVNLNAATQPVTDPAEVLLVTARFLGEHLGADRCAYAEVEDDEDHFQLTGNYTHGVSSIVGRYSFSQFGAEVLRCMKAGEPFVSHDVELAPNLGPDLSAFHATEIRSVICVPLHKNGKFTAAMAVHQKEARVWTGDEIELVQLVVARCWEALERTRVARNLREQEERLRLASSAASLGTWDYDLQSGVLDWDARCRELFGLSLSAPVDYEVFLSGMHPEDRERVKGQVGLALDPQTQAGYDVEYRTISPVDKSERWVRAIGTVIFRNGVAIRFVGTLQDITERKRAEQALLDADRRKDEFLATLAHELRNPLAPIRTGIELLRMSEDDPAKMRQIRAIMERQTHQMVRLIDDLLDVSRITRGRIALQKSDLDLRTVVESAVEATWTLLEENRHQLTVNLPETPILMEADAARLAQVVTNLLNNAAKYTRPGGRIILTAEIQGPEAIVIVKDNGIGIPREMLDSIFELFTQVDHSLEKSHGGLGIGLTLVKRLVEMHGGTITVQSEGLNQGSRFTVRLPRLQNATPSLPDIPPPPLTPKPATATKRILVADDNKDAVNILEMMLKSLGHEVYTAGDGKAACDAAAAVHPDLIFLDLGMPRMNGYDAAKWIRRQPWGAGVKMVALTGWGQEEDQRRTKEAGFDHHLVKPVDPVWLQQMIAGM